MNTSINHPATINSVSNSEIRGLSSLQDVESLVLQSIRKKIQLWIENSEQNSPASTTRCRDCGKVANFSTKRVGFVRTQFGLIRYLRSHYLCPHCHNSTYPLDERLNPVESLARMRTKVAAGKTLPVAELAQAWGLGSLDIFPDQSLNSAEKYSAEIPMPRSAVGTKSTTKSHDRIIPIFC
jgi:hypothetical protein